MERPKSKLIQTQVHVDSFTSDCFEPYNNSQKKLIRELMHDTRAIGWPVQIIINKLAASGLTVRTPVEILPDTDILAVEKGKYKRSELKVKNHDMTFEGSITLREFNRNPEAYLARHTPQITEDYTEE